MSFLSQYPNAVYSILNINRIRGTNLILTTIQKKKSAFVSMNLLIDFEIDQTFYRIISLQEKCQVMHIK